MNRFIYQNLLVLLGCLFIVLSSEIRANNITVSNISLTGQNTSDNYTFVRFDISWENSWRTSSAPNNWDAAWVFVKYRVGSGNWLHATLRASGHIAPAGSAITAPEDNKGIFFYRSADGSGTFSKSGVKLRWDYGLDGVGSNDVVDVKVFAIEMVYVPQGAFYVGMGGTSTATFYTQPTSGSSYFISGENEISVGLNPGDLYYESVGVDQGDQLGPIPAAFPKGYNAVYCMKYEISQQRYVDFLNSLTRFQQNVRSGNGVNLASGLTNVTNRYVMSNTATMTKRNGIRCDATIPASSPITFYCDYNGNGIGGEADDGQNIACNYINWADFCAYMDWASLRPMTEFEFEKISRGPVAPVSGVFAWGTAGVTQNTGISNPGTNFETTSTTGANASYGNNLNVQGPMRVGNFATAISTRVTSGGCYYGAMDMSGNSWERPVTVGNPTGRNYTGLHGNGTLNLNGDADVLNWPGVNAVGGGFRGGWWGESVIYMRIGARGYASHPGDLRRERMGGRGVRTVN